ncbi:MAG: outer membrane beta-barrel protein [Bacteroidota bacterium]
MNLLPVVSVTDNKSYNQEATIQVDYTNPIGKNHIIELGGKNISRTVFEQILLLQCHG